MNWTTKLSTPRGFPLRSTSNIVILRASDQDARRICVPNSPLELLKVADFFGTKLNAKRTSEELA